MRPSPPKYALRFLRWFCREDYLDEIEGDLTELFEMRTEKSSKRAKARFWWDVVKSFRIRNIKSIRKSQNLNYTTMLQHYFKVSWRNLLKNRSFSAINICGMAISLSSFFIISLFIYDEFQFDKHVDDFAFKYRVYNEHFKQSRDFSIIPPIIGSSLGAEFPEVEYYTRYMNFNNPPVFRVGEKKIVEVNGGFADHSVFEMFNLKLLEGDRNGALKDANSIAINETLRKKYFGNNSALGETIKVFNQNYSVAAVYQDFPAHSHLHINYFISMERLAMVRPDRMQDWGWSGVLTYIKLKPGSDALALEAKLQQFVKSNAVKDDFYTPRLMPLQDVYLHASNQAWDIASHGNIQTIYILTATAVFILIIAILNFANLSTARSMSRVKEVGLRKVVGATRKQLVYQFIAESILITFVGMVLGLAITAAALPTIGAFVEKSFGISDFLNPQVTVVLLVFTLFIGMIAGFYPAFYISRFRPAQILSQHKFEKSSGKGLTRKGLVIMQFILSFFLIVASLTVSRQYSYMRYANMGFNKADLVVIRLRGKLFENLATAKAEFTSHPNVLSASFGYGLPGEAYAGETIIDGETNEGYGISMLFADADYVKTLGLELVAGRDFLKESVSDENHGFVVSETAARILGYSNVNDAIGHELSWEMSAVDSLKKGKIIGVIKDLQLNSMRDAVTPVVLQIYPVAYSTLIVKVKHQNIPATIAHLESTWNALNPDFPFEFKFLDDNFDRMYKLEERLATMFTAFTYFAIFVACLGLLGLVVYCTSHRYKEISIRKVLGASELSIVFQLSRNYFLLLGIAFVIAAPFSYYVAWQWLQKFAYRISLTPILFVHAGLFVTAISLLTVGFISLRAARNNPVNAIRNE